MTSTQANVIIFLVHADKTLTGKWYDLVCVHCQSFIQFLPDTKWKLQALKKQVEWLAMQLGTLAQWYSITG